MVWWCCADKQGDLGVAPRESLRPCLSAPSMSGRRLPRRHSRPSLGVKISRERAQKVFRNGLRRDKPRRFELRGRLHLGPTDLGEILQGLVPCTAFLWNGGKDALNFVASQKAKAGTMNRETDPRGKVWRESHDLNKSHFISGLVGSVTSLPTLPIPRQSEPLRPRPSARVFP